MAIKHVLPPTESAFAKGSASSTPPQGGSEIQHAPSVGVFQQARQGRVRRGRERLKHAIPRPFPSMKNVSPDRFCLTFKFSCSIISTATELQGLNSEPTNIERAANQAAAEFKTHLHPPGDLKQGEILFSSKFHRGFCGEVNGVDSNAAGPIAASLVIRETTIIPSFLRICPSTGG